MTEALKAQFENKSLALLGFGREGQSTYKLLRKAFPTKTLIIIDENDAIRTHAMLQGDSNVQFITGKGCMQEIDRFDVALKSPGIPSNTLPRGLKKVYISSQTDLFLQYYGRQVIGVTGTKGKSTTASLVYHVLKNAGKNTLLVGNIGIPPFDCIPEIKPDTVIVMELSSHQLEYVSHAPHIGILLNIFQEHLDHYYTYEDYQLAKFNIGKYQDAADYFIYNSDNPTLTKLVADSGKLPHQAIAFSLSEGNASGLHIHNKSIEFQLNNQAISLYDFTEGQPLKGHHNLYNIMAASAAAFLAGVLPGQIQTAVQSFNGLEHRIEAVGTFAGIEWYNDSIATIPEATIEAVKTLVNVDTLILGGFDRGIDYGVLYPFLVQSGIRNLIFVGEAGLRMKNELVQFGSHSLHMYFATDFQNVVRMAREVTKPGKICLLSPAAASYDMFKNFEERGNVYKKNVRALEPSHS